MTIKRTTMISLRLENRDLDEFEKNVKTTFNPDGRFLNLSECVRELAKVGCKVLEYQDMMKDPAKADEFKQKMQEMLQTQQIDEWSQTLTTEQIDGFVMFLSMEKEKRFEQKKFI